MEKQSANLDAFESKRKNCAVCSALMSNLQHFFDMLSGCCRPSDWLTVDEVATELKISKSIVYRLVRNGELEAVDIVEANGRVAQKGHYRIRRSSLNQYLESKKVKPLPNEPPHKSHPRYPKVRNHLGL